MSLRQSVISGVLWSAFARAGQQFIQFGISVWLARLLTPADFGLMSIVLTVNGLAGLFTDFGLSSALVQRQDLHERHTQSIFWLNVAIGCLAAAVLIGCAPWLARFYRSPVLVTGIRAASLGLIGASVSVVPSGLLQRAMRFDKLAVARTTSTVTAGALAVGAAIKGAGVWSLVIQAVCNVFLLAAITSFFSRWRPKLKFSPAALREVIPYSSCVFGFSFINYWARNTDNLLIGRVFGPAPLGIYNRAYALMLMPISQITNVIADVMFSALSSIQQDVDRVRLVYLRTIGLVALFTFPLMLGLFVTVRPFVLAVYGPKWAGVIPVLRVLALIGALQSIVNPVGLIYESQGRADKQLIWGLFAGALVIIAIVIGTALGSILAVAICYGVASVVLFYPAVAIPGKLIRMTASDVLLSVAGPLSAASIMALSLYLVGLVWIGNSNPWLHLTVSMILGLAVYVAALVGLRVNAGRDLIWLASEGWKGPKRLWLAHQPELP